MKSQTLLTAAVVAIWAVTPASTQSTSPSACNPLTGSCPPDTALGKAVNIDFTSGASDSFTPSGNPTYDSNGASFTISAPGDAPQITSKWYIMFGHVDFVVKAAPGVGIVSSAILQSDDLDEIDFEWLGYDNTQVQTNYFGKGQTTDWNRGASSPAPNNQGGFNTYTIDWTADQIVWSINGQSVRTLSSSNTGGYPYPQTPMVIKVGAWDGAASDQQGTVEWATGQSGAAAVSGLTGGPYTMEVKSIAVTDYSTGSQYTYSGNSGTWNSISAVGGTVNPSGKGAAPVQSAASSSVTGTTNGPMPFQGTHSSKESSVSQPNAGGWSPTTLQTSTTATATTYPGLPAGWTVTSSGKVVPPSAAPVTSPPASPTSSPAASPQGSPSGGLETVTTYDQQGFLTTITQQAGLETAAKHYDNQGFLITSTSALSARSSPSPADPVVSSSPVAAPDTSASSAAPKVSVVPSMGTTVSLRGFALTLGMAFCFLAGMLIL